jgi:hypothetical protein
VNDQDADQDRRAPTGPTGADLESTGAGDRRGRSEGSKRTWFKPGVSGNPRGRPKGIRSRKRPWALLECRAVLDQPAERDSTDMQRSLRKMLTQTPDKFFDLMRRIEEIGRHWYD